jgi:hypothetical protein
MTGFCLRAFAATPPKSLAKSKALAKEFLGLLGMLVARVFCLCQLMGLCCRALSPIAVRFASPLQWNGILVPNHA